MDVNRPVVMISQYSVHYRSMWDTWNGCNVICQLYLKKDTLCERHSAQFRALSLRSVDASYCHRCHKLVNSSRDVAQTWCWAPIPPGHPDLDLDAGRRALEWPENRPVHQIKNLESPWPLQCLLENKTLCFFIFTFSIFAYSVHFFTSQSQLQSFVLFFLFCFSWTNHS